MSLKKMRRARRRRKASAAIVPSPAPLAQPRVIPMLDGKTVLGHFFSELAPKTVNAYKRDLALFADFLGCSVSEAVDSFLKLNRGEANAVALAWLDEMSQKGRAPSTRARRLATLRGLARAARSVGLIEWGIDIKTPRVQRYKDTRGPDLKAVHRLLVSWEGDELEHHRNRLIILLLCGMGLRRAEVTSLRRMDYDGKYLHIVGKGNKVVNTQVPEQTRQALDLWLDKSLSIRGPGDDAPVVCSLSNPGGGLPLSEDGLNRIVHRIGERAGVEVWPHALRHSAITIGLDAERSLRDVTRFSRHSDPKTVQIYDDNRQDLGGSVAQTVTDLILSGGKKG